MKRAAYTVGFLFFLGAWTGHKGITQTPRAADAQTALSPQEQQEMVDRHNHWRGEVGAPNLRGSSSLTAHAQEWADELASLGCNMVHRDQDQYGENLTRFAPRWSTS